MAKPDVVIIGAGAAGIMAAIQAAKLGAKVLVLEKTNRIGTKILISGGGKCNVAHDGPLEDVIKAFRPNEAKFIRPACYRMPNRQVIELFTSRGLNVYTRPDGRVFPVDQTAKDVVAILRDYLKNLGVEVRTECPVEQIVAEQNVVTGVRLGKPEVSQKPSSLSSEKAYGAKGLLRAVQNDASVTEAPSKPLPDFIQCSKVILATGGSSYPTSGTTGDGWQWAKQLGHSLVKIRAALAPIYLKDVVVERSGVALRDCILKARQSNKEVAKWQGDLLFTHQGISGPTALGISRIVAEKLELGPVQLEVDLVPGTPFEDLNSDILNFTTKHPKKLIRTYLEELIPESLVLALLTSAEMPPETFGAKLDKKSRNRLVSGIKSWNLGEVRTVPIEKGEVVAGGVSLEEVDPQTMRSKIIQGLYLCGEVLDVAGPVGGYNLQSAFATGHVAGDSAAKDCGY